MPYPRVRALQQPIILFVVFCFDDHQIYGLVSLGFFRSLGQNPDLEPSPRLHNLHTKIKTGNRIPYSSIQLI
jgi:hypothetical protein